MQQVKINGKAWPVNFGIAAKMKLEKLSGRAFYDLIYSILPKTENKNSEVDETELGMQIMRNASLKDLAQILYCGMWGGAYKQKKDFDLTFDDLLVMLDDCDDMLTVLTQGLFHVVDALDGKAKKKTEKATKAKQ